MSSSALSEQTDSANESCPSLASFVASLLQEKMHDSFKSSGFDRITVDIIDDNVIHSKAESLRSMPRCRQSLVTMRRQRSTRQLSRWENTFQPHDSDPNLMRLSSSLNEGRRVQPKRAMSEGALQIPQRRESPRLPSRLPAKSKKISSNARWTVDADRNSRQPSMRISELFDETLKLSPETEESSHASGRISLNVENNLFLGNSWVPCYDPITSAREESTGSVLGHREPVPVRAKAASQLMDNAPVLPSRGEAPNV
jgi:hypothetical protein